MPRIPIERWPICYSFGLFYARHPSAATVKYVYVHRILRSLFVRLVVESGLGLDSGLKSIFAGLGLGLGGSASKSFFEVLCFVPILKECTYFLLKRQKLFANYTYTREHHSDTATDVSVAELLARYLRDLDGDCDSEPVDFWIRNKATYDKLIPAVQRTFAIPASSAPVEKGFQPWEHCATATQSTHV